MANKVGGKITGVILSVLGLAFAAGSLYFAQQSLDLFQDGITAQGSVARVESHSGTCGSGAVNTPAQNIADSSLSPIVQARIMSFSIRTLRTPLLPIASDRE